MPMLGFDQKTSLRPRRLPHGKPLVGIVAKPERCSMAVDPSSPLLLPLCLCRGPGGLGDRAFSASR